MRRNYGRLVPVDPARVVEAPDGFTLELGGAAAPCSSTRPATRGTTSASGTRPRARCSPATPSASPTASSRAGAAPSCCRPRPRCSSSPRRSCASIDRLVGYAPRADAAHPLLARHRDRAAGRRPAAADRRARGARPGRGRHARPRPRVCARACESCSWAGCATTARRSPTERVRELLALDVELNAQGLEAWLDRDRRPAVHEPPCTMDFMSRRLAALRRSLDVMPSPVEDRPGLLLRDPFGYTEDVVIVPPPLVRFLRFFDGRARGGGPRRPPSTGPPGASGVGLARRLAETLGGGGFLEDEELARRREARHRAFAEARDPRAGARGRGLPDATSASWPASSTAGSGPPRRRGRAARRTSSRSRRRTSAPRAASARYAAAYRALPGGRGRRPDGRRARHLALRRPRSASA